MGNTNSEELELKWLEKTKYSRAITFAIDYIVAKFKHCKSSRTEDLLPATSNFLEAMESYHAYFPKKTCIYTFPPDNDGDDGNYRPSPHYHFIEG